jgi:hypothetical protein
VHFDEGVSWLCCWNCGARALEQRHRSWDQTLSSWIDEMAPEIDWGVAIMVPVMLGLLLRHLSMIR